MAPPIARTVPMNMAAGRAARGASRLVWRTVPTTAEVGAER